MNGRMMQMIGNIVKQIKLAIQDAQDTGGSLQTGLLGRC